MIALQTRMSGIVAWVAGWKFESPCRMNSAKINVIHEHFIGHHKYMSLACTLTSSPRLIIGRRRLYRKFDRLLSCRNSDVSQCDRSKNMKRVFASVHGCRCSSRRSQRRTPFDQNPSSGFCIVFFSTLIFTLKRLGSGKVPLTVLAERTSVTWVWNGELSRTLMMLVGSIEYSGRRRKCYRRRASCETCS